MKKVILFLGLSLFHCGLTRSQSIIINEISQGPSGAKEYVEFLVTGTPVCSTTLPCLDLRGYIFDDNNGTFAPGAGTGIASGCVRFANTAFWSCIPIGTIIVIYNDADQNASLPAQDLSMSDGNCRLVIPVSNCVLLEKHASQPSAGISSYPSSGFVSCGNWTPLSMANSDDSFQIRDAAGTLLHGISWGNNTTANIIYFSGTAGGMAIYMSNAINNNPALQANWTEAVVAGNETPGAPNNAANAAWISSMNNSCVPLSVLNASVSSSNAGCTCSGSATVNASGAMAPYTYSWAPSGGNAAVASGMCPGNYTCTVSSANGCTNTVTVTITSAITLSAVPVITPVSCNGGSDGTITLAVSGASGPVTYSWAPSGGTGIMAGGLSAGTYTASVSDASGCSISINALVSEPAALTAAINQSNVSCNGGTNGVASVFASGGNSGYTYSWSSSGSTSASATNLGAGTCICTVTDAKGCIVLAAATLTEPPAINAMLSHNDVLCNGASTGSASVTASGGTGAYTYAWSPSGGTGAAVNGLNAGNYACTVSDANSCSAVFSLVISEPPALTASSTSTNLSCNGSGNGSAAVSVSGGTGAYTYSWLPIGGNASSATSLPAGSYTCTISDAASCQLTKAMSITEPLPISISVSNANICSGQNATLTAAVSGGTLPLAYSWNGGASSGSGITISPPSSTSISVVVTDANGCVSPVASGTINVALPLSLSISPGDSICPGSSGTLSALASGGVGPYQYTWQPGNMIGPTISVSPALTTSYTVTANDICTVPGISAAAAIILKSTPAVYFSTSGQDACAYSCVDFKDSSSVAGSSMTSWNWNFGDGATSSLKDPTHCYNQTGSFAPSLTVTASNGCSSFFSSSVPIDLSAAPVADFTASSYEQSILSPEITFTNISVNAVAVTWVFPDGSTGNQDSFNHEFTAEGIYPVLLIAYNSKGCADSSIKNIIVVPEFSFYAPDAFSPTGDLLNEKFLPLGEGWDEKRYRLQVFDRWGNNIFNTDDPNEGWNGKVNGVPAEVDTYAWKVDVFDLFNKKHNFYGQLTIVR
ncbi:MAG: PKD domain-containing protein [Bacteroidia bacterium]